MRPHLWASSPLLPTRRRRLCRTYFLGISSAATLSPSRGTVGQEALAGQRSGAVGSSVGEERGHLKSLAFPSLWLIIFLKSQHSHHCWWLWVKCPLNVNSEPPATQGLQKGKELGWPEDAFEDSVLGGKVESHFSPCIHGEGRGRRWNVGQWETWFAGSRLSEISVLSSGSNSPWHMASPPPRPRPGEPGRPLIQKRGREAFYVPWTAPYELCAQFFHL